MRLNVFRLLWIAAAAAFVHGPHAAAQIPVFEEDQKLLAPDGAASDWFGRAVAVSGDVMVVGANGDDDLGFVSGSAHVFRWDGASWVHQQKLLASDGEGADWFGAAVAASGDVIVVGAVFEDGRGYRSGSAYVFRWDGAAWVEEQKLLADDGAPQDRFGVSVAVSGDAIVIGAHNDEVAGVITGSAYVFRWDGTMWVQEQKLLASDGAHSDLFGEDVAVSGDVAVVGAHRDDDRGGDSGSAYIFRWDGAEWVEERKLLAFGTSRTNRFGEAVAASDDMVVVGTAWDQAVYVFRWDGTTWLEEQKLIASAPTGGDRFGEFVATSGDVIVVGATGSHTTSYYTGAAHLFRRDHSAWKEERKLVASDGARDDQLGFSVAVSGDTVVLGAPSDDDLGDASGSTYFFSVRPCYADCDLSGAADAFDFLCFQNLFLMRDPAADCDGSGVLDFFDFRCFQDAFAAGCP